jgi:hypothetical protein
MATERIGLTRNDNRHAHKEEQNEENPAEQRKALSLNVLALLDAYALQNIGAPSSFDKFEIAMDAHEANRQSHQQRDRAAHTIGHRSGREAIHAIDDASRNASHQEKGDEEGDVEQFVARDIFGGSLLEASICLGQQIETEPTCERQELD